MAFLNFGTKKAIAYYRHSAEDKQEQSVPIQREQVQAFAVKHNIEIIHEEADEGESGLTAKRPAFQRLLRQWIENPTAPEFDHVLVLNVSRWGRFENLNEPASYEFLCNQRGKNVIYVDLGFPKNENAIMEQMMVTLQRVGAFEYSKKLSLDVFRGAIKTAQRGFSAGGYAPYGYMRMMLNAAHEPVGILKKGEHKAIDNYRITFVAADDGSAGIVKEIFSQFVDHGIGYASISDALNARAVASPGDKEWTRASVLRLLRNPAYTGTLVYNKTGGKLKRPRRKNPAHQWIVCANAFSGLVDLQVFERAQERLRRLLPLNAQGGMPAVMRAKRLLNATFIEFLTKEGFDRVQAERVIDRLPISFAVSMRRADGKEQWCFRLPRAADRSVLGVGIGTHQEEDHVFLIPRDAFRVGDYRMIAENDNAFSLGGLQETELKDTVMTFVREAM